ncbi:hypothetical protein F5887DRAFT_922860 [Amanita rubescens]|nr:hypothetical protein F5887DRAFT_922860 [Amanita rubescens]
MTGMGYWHLESPFPRASEGGINTLHHTGSSTSSGTRYAHRRLVPQTGRTMHLNRQRTWAGSYIPDAVAAAEFGSRMMTMMTYTQQLGEDPYLKWEVAVVARVWPGTRNSAYRSTAFSPALLFLRNQKWAVGIVEEARAELEYGGAAEENGRGQGESSLLRLIRTVRRTYSTVARPGGCQTCSEAERAVDMGVPTTAGVEME